MARKVKNSSSGQRVGSLPSQIAGGVGSSGGTRDPAELMVGRSDERDPAEEQRRVRAVGAPVTRRTASDLTPTFLKDAKLEVSKPSFIRWFMTTCPRECSACAKKVVACGYPPMANDTQRNFRCTACRNEHGGVCSWLQDLLEVYIREAYQLDVGEAYVLASSKEKDPRGTLSRYYQTWIAEPARRSSDDELRERLKALHANLSWEHPRKRNNNRVTPVRHSRLMQQTSAQHPSTRSSLPEPQRKPLKRIKLIVPSPPEQPLPVQASPSSPVQASPPPPAQASPPPPVQASPPSPVQASPPPPAQASPPPPAQASPPPPAQASPPPPAQASPPPPAQASPPPPVQASPPSPVQASPPPPVQASPPPPVQASTPPPVQASPPSPVQAFPPPPVQASSPSPVQASPPPPPSSQGTSTHAPIRFSLGLCQLQSIPTVVPVNFSPPTTTPLNITTLNIHSNAAQDPRLPSCDIVRLKSNMATLSNGLAKLVVEDLSLQADLTNRQEAESYLLKMLQGSLQTCDFLRSVVDQQSSRHVAVTRSLEDRICSLTLENGQLKQGVVGKCLGQKICLLEVENDQLRGRLVRQDQELENGKLQEGAINGLEQKIRHLEVETEQLLGKLAEQEQEFATMSAHTQLADCALQLISQQDLPTGDSQTDTDLTDLLSLIHAHFDDIQSTPAK
ncbi:hypothetical protein EV424DRAFT_1347493 [Suillus variegatus]|nr:hypothetical protein EV424DRAFT_1347493 [Suillus variegatus]